MKVHVLDNQTAKPLCGSIVKAGLGSIYGPDKVIVSRIVRGQPIFWCTRCLEKHYRKPAKERS